MGPPGTGTEIVAPPVDEPEAEGGVETSLNKAASVGGNPDNGPGVEDEAEDSRRRGLGVGGTLVDGPAAEGRVEGPGVEGTLDDGPAAERGGRVEDAPAGTGRTLDDEP